LIADSARLQSEALDSSLGKSQAYALMAECDTRDLVSIAGRLRERTRPEKIVTYSRKVFINLVNLCRDSCSYCTYKKDPGEAMLSLLNPAQVLAIAEAGSKLHCTEALFVTGERPEQTGCTHWAIPPLSSTSLK
jgi:FO synthase